jgi:hypothetical protein
VTERGFERRLELALGGIVLFKKKFLSALLCPAGFVMCLIGILLPWRVRNAYLKVIAAVFDIVLRLDFFVSFFMDVGFASKQAMKHM